MRESDASFTKANALSGWHRLCAMMAPDDMAMTVYDSIAAARCAGRRGDVPSSKPAATP